jgi:hypothetical protein
MALLIELRLLSTIFIWSQPLHFHDEQRLGTDWENFHRAAWNFPHNFVLRPAKSRFFPLSPIGMLVAVEEA